MISKTLLRFIGTAKWVHKNAPSWILQLGLFLLFVKGAVDWLDRAATGSFWHLSIVHGTAVAVLVFYALLSVRGIRRLLRWIFGSGDESHVFVSTP